MITPEQLKAALVVASHHHARRLKSPAGTRMEHAEAKTFATIIKVAEKVAEAPTAVARLREFGEFQPYFEGDVSARVPISWAGHRIHLVDFTNNKD